MPGPKREPYFFFHFIIILDTSSYILLGLNPIYIWPLLIIYIDLLSIRASEIAFEGTKFDRVVVRL